jgi:hypothetical protein
MIDNLPEDVITLILNNLEDKNTRGSFSKVSYCRMDINYILSLRNINHFFKRFIEKQRKLWVKIHNNDMCGISDDNSSRISKPNIIESRSSQVDDLCLKKTPINVFRWLFDNNIHLSTKNIKTLIIKNRIDVFLLGFHYQEFLKTIFNRFNLCSSNDIFGLSENTNPMITAVRNNRLNIVKLLIETSSYGNPYLDQIESIFEESIKYINTGVLNYLLVYHYDKLKGVINRKLNTLILRFNNIEDILFYIVINKKAIVTREIIKSIISKNYIDLFKYCYKNYFHTKNNSDLLLKCLESNSFIIFEYLMDNGSYINPIEFSEVFLSKKKHNTLFLNTILDKYPDLLPLNTGIISLSIKNKVDSGRIEKLVNNNYYYNERDIITVLEDKNIKLAKLMINTYKD